ncbi:protein FAM216A [Denticeps clupeoides]|uniref:protein FAM216A n=1 Tax=Denticeps clupeoides TaxID=299321 RepID=UPI0010A566EA|nr:uncharacterized protein LOC114785203 [Denticeps clupeoides]
MATGHVLVRPSIPEGLLKEKQVNGPCGFLKVVTGGPPHPSLTPGQKRYLRGVAAAHSEGHVARLIQQHYFNIVHRCIRTGPAPHLSGDPLRLLAARHTSEPFADWKPGTVQSESFISEKESQSRTRRKGRLGPERRTVLPSIDGSKRRAAATMPRAHKKRANKAGKKAPVRGTSKHYKDDSAEDSLDELLKDRFTDDEDVL